MYKFLFVYHVIFPNFLPCFFAVLSFVNLKCMIVGYVAHFQFYNFTVYRSHFACKFDVKRTCNRIRIADMQLTERRKIERLHILATLMPSDSYLFSSLQQSP